MWRFAIALDSTGVSRECVHYCKYALWAFGLHSKLVLATVDKKKKACASMWSQLHAHVMAMAKGSTEQGIDRGE